MAPGEECATEQLWPAAMRPAVRKDLLVARISHYPNSEPKVEDIFLIALAKQGDRNAYDRLVRRYHGFVRLKASSYFLAGGDSEDLIQEGLVGLYKAIRDFRTDRESSFRNFAELCITRQIITAVKTATRNKHTPLNQLRLVLVPRRPAAATTSPPSTRCCPGRRCTPGQPGHLLREPAGSWDAFSLPCRELESRVLTPVSRRLLLRADRRETLVRHEDGGQRPAARQAQGRRPPAVPRRSSLSDPLTAVAAPEGRHGARRRPAGG